jgi:thiamine pyrophosphate-dependent acetolactate synthase large subunit-like protein
MKDQQVYEGLADCFVAEGVRMQFALMGDGNMHFSTDLEKRHGVETIHVRHEHCAVGGAMGYFSATGETGMASVTCGPGYTQTITALVSAARGRIPLVLFAGEAPLAAKFYHQRIEQAPFALHSGAHYIAGHSLGRLQEQVREAFYIARTERKPVVLGVPYDLQKHQMPDGGPYVPAWQIIPARLPAAPHPQAITALAERLRQARHPILIGGLGALASGAHEMIERLADRSGALLANTLPGRGMFDQHPYSLGVCGGYARPAALPVFAKADLVIAFGASLSYYTLHGGKIFPEAQVVQVSLEPEGWRSGLQIAHDHVQADAKLTAEALLAELGTTETRSKARDPGLTDLLRNSRIDVAGDQVEPGTLNPIIAFEELEKVIPKDYHAVSGTGHQSYFHTTLRGYDPARYHHMRDFGAVGFSISHAIGVAAAAGDGKVVLFDGDGSLMMYLGELDTIARHGLKMLIVCANDGAYGAEIHKLRADGLPADGAIHGRPNFEALARGFGLRGATVRDPGAFAALLAEYEAEPTAMIWDVHVSDRIVSPSLARSIRTGHGVR